MIKNLAIIILGDQNVGKTTTIRRFLDIYHTHKKVTVLKKGMRYGLSPFTPNFDMVKIDAYILPSSPTESGIALSDSIKVIGWNPHLILMAEQDRGKEYANSINFLRNENYHIKEFHVKNIEELQIWSRWKYSAEMNTKLHYRVEEIAEYIRGFILSKI
ncbi:P-loop NTPase family protein [Pedobacter hartonius]|uniref:Uncharacterized protein n=1 Tax=Pedobacter hartonius TaxID=425514 RepID=A0A1H4DVD0_9SPHI|nr:hypothetical protein [Pedobacter hartonius]SEA76733.1 hypothetical protein SAMN05443550_105123 [Pedobacter hartonius]